MKIVRLAACLGVGVVWSIGCGGDTPVISPVPSGGSDAAIEASASAMPDVGGAPATFANLYASIFVPSCSGSSCHNPGSHEGVSFVSPMTGYDSVRGLVMPGNARGSKLYTLVATGRMPPNGPALSSEQLAAIANWIDGGALND